MISARRSLASRRKSRRSTRMSLVSERISRRSERNSRRSRGPTFPVRPFFANAAPAEIQTNASSSKRLRKLFVLIFFPPYSNLGSTSEYRLLNRKHGGEKDTTPFTQTSARR